MSKEATNALGKRMKDYEKEARSYLASKTPVIIRIDGKAFHTFTRGLNRPYDVTFRYCMTETVKYLCKNVQNCKLGYTQSDEITLVLLDDLNENSSTFFDNQIEKICSVTASMATLAFNKTVYEKVQEFQNRLFLSPNDKELKELVDVWTSKMFKAEFDARCFNVPNRTEVLNALINRQQDAIKNSITMLALAHFSTKELDKVNSSQKLEMLSKKNIDWNTYSTHSKSGVVIYKEFFDKEGALRSRWTVDENTPIFTEHPSYILDFLSNK